MKRTILIFQMVASWEQICSRQKLKDFFPLNSAVVVVNNYKRYKIN